MMRALTPITPPARETGTEADPPFDFGLDPGGQNMEGMPEAAFPRIARSEDPEPGAIERMRQRLAEIRRRAESGGIVRAERAEISPSQPVAPPDSADPAPVAPSAAVSPSRPEDPGVFHGEESPAVEESAATEPTFSPEVPGSEPAPAAPEDFDGISTEIPPEPLPPAPAESMEASTPEPEAPAWPRQPGPLHVPEGPLAVRLDAFRRWLAAECGVMNPVVFDRHGCPLHAADGQNALVAAAVSLGTAWRDACALTDPPGTLRAVHSGWGGGTMAVIPVPTRFGDLYVAGLVQAAIEPSLAATIGAALRRAAGV